MKRPALPFYYKEDRAMKRCRITVMRKVHHADLSAQYENPIEHACDMAEGQVFLCNGWEKPSPRLHLTHRTCTHSYTHAHTHMHTCVCIHVMHMYTPAGPCTHTYAPVHAYTCAHTYTHTCIHMYTYVCIGACGLSAFAWGLAPGAPAGSPDPLTPRFIMICLTLR